MNYKSYCSFNGDNMEANIKENERIDDLQLKGLKIIQNVEGFCFGVDAVLLSDFAEIKKGQRVMDLGTGTGIVPILMAGKTEAGEIIGLEIQSEVAEMAQRSMLLNHIDHRVKIFNEDINNALDIFGKESFDAITTNPPYKHGGSGIVNPEDAKAISRHEVKCTLEDVISVSSRLLKNNGRFFMVHRPERIVDILFLMRQYKLEPKRVRFVHPYPGKRPNLLLIEGLKYGKAFLKFMDPLYVYDGNGSYTKEIDEIYRRGEA
ncbi:tRNA1(Val) (adenine(37)-N6)-methyltransferase [Oxobacter pfennigii]|uniref:tRNA1(Val) (Adenine(37)-N6)-methyltransferase n=1 Tax=Oxobacter pfennigii TaxID=36849 RepID=A0A0P8W590_9CLOT|nr:tRNA1(Val) (adenine(37)-N6)-methyltransferase [Oxobacter pfennigii]KPU43066.1 tRNA1(Val) (adenine(37)-N6)-methyltransferase [Oxobacter pfennigii]